ncbi:LysR family transcriptional regulator [Kocuria soli]|uniref:LysR family transcriptional regulator n=1 Tax=Kocuria soli TaxID=2485125 RepID=A0A3N4A671_9MICC|nr:LysR family transcriptional regulator [Kocuria soli]ROZ64281.1 LysR family transcriptional regulator [Kocuria soli]
MGHDVDNLLLLLSVVRHGSYAGAGASLGLSHTTVSRRIAAVEKSAGARLLVRAGGVWEPTELGREFIAAAEDIEHTLGSLTSGVGGQGGSVRGVVRALVPEGFGGLVIGEAMRRLGETHPLVRLEMINAARRARANLVGIDFEVVVGRPEVSRNEAFHLADYSLGLYAAPSYLETHQAITEPEQVQEHPLVYFVESMQDVPELTNPVRHLPRMRQSVGATSSMVHVELTRAGAGIGLLPCYMAERAGGLVRLFPDDLTFPVSYWVVSRPDLMRRPAVHAVLDAIRGTVDDMRDELIAAPQGA